MGGGCVNHILTFGQVEGKVTEIEKEMCAALMDFKKVYDNVNKKEVLIL